jgi:hypothetical protein
MKCSDVSSLLVDFLYEEMPAAERRDFLAHIDGCASCSAEVKAMSSTLGHARAALRGPLAEEPPSRMRTRILETAEAAAAVQTANSAKPPATRVPQPEGFFSRLRRTPWLVPALGAASVATVVLLVKVIKNPQVLPEQRPAAAEILAPPAAEPLRQAQPQPEAELKRAFSPPSTLRLAKKSPAEPDDDSHAQARHAVAAAKPRAATLSPSNLATSGRRLAQYYDGFLGEEDQVQARAPTGEAKTGKGGLSAAAPGKAPAAAIARQPPAPTTPADKDEAIRGPASKSLADDRSGASGAGAGSANRWAEPPPPRPAETPAAFAATPVGAAPPQATKAERVPVYEDRMDSARSEPARPAERVKAEAPVRAPAARPAAQAETPADMKKATESKQSISFEERVRKAEKLFAEKKWAEAAAAFRALLAQAPSNPAAKTWRERVAAAESAQEPARAVKAKAKISNDALDGL